MKIISKTKTRIKDVEIEPGIGDYPLDHTDPLVEKALFVLKFEQKVINFFEVLPMEKKVNEEKAKREASDKARKQERIDRINKKRLEKRLAAEKAEDAAKKKAKDVRRGNKAAAKAGRNGSANSGGGGVPDKTKNSSAARRPLPKRRDADNKAS
jgi:hypothetical protein